jgi:hypothetical protein
VPPRWGDSVAVALAPSGPVHVGGGVVMVRRDVGLRPAGHRGGEVVVTGLRAALIQMYGVHRDDRALHTRRGGRVLHEMRDGAHVAGATGGLVSDASTGGWVL